MGSIKLIVVGCDMVLVKTKNVIKRKPRSTMGVRSTRVERRLTDLEKDLLLLLFEVVVISAMRSSLLFCFDS